MRPALLWVEDDRCLARALARELRHLVADIHLRHVTSEPEAVEILRSDLPLVAFLVDPDLGAGGDGLAALEEARRCRPDLRGAVLTGSDRPDVEIRTFRSEALLLHKPVPAHEIAAWIRRLIEPDEAIRLAPLRRAVDNLAKETGITEVERAELVASLRDGSDRKAVAARMTEILGRPVSVEGVKDARERVVDRVRAKHLVANHESVLALLRSRISGPVR